MEKYPWYTIVNGEDTLLQGDFIYSCPVIIPPQSIETITVSVDIIEYDVVILSQSCDLIQKKIDLVLVCPIWTLKEFEQSSDFFKSRNGKEALRQGNVPGYHLLNKCEINNYKTDFLIVDFRSVYSVPFDFINELVNRKGHRLRLLSPYREHLAQAFARFFMRVGLPIDIPKFK